MSLSLKVEVVAGKRIRTAIIDAKILATKLDCMVTFDFNGVYMVVTKNSSLEEREEYFDNQVFVKMSSSEGESK